jgi:hypothetical protein
MLFMGSHGRLSAGHLVSLRGQTVPVALALLVLGICPGLVCAGPPASMNDLMRSVKVQQALTADDELRGLDVRVEIREGMAIIRGTVPTAELAELLVQKVQQMEGVTVVVRDRLQVAAPLSPVIILPGDTPRSTPLETRKTTDYLAGPPSRRAEAGFPGIDPMPSLTQAAPQVIVQAGDRGPRIFSTPQVIAQGPAGPQVSTSLRTNLPPPINTTSEPAVRQDWSFNRVPQDETLPQVVARVRKFDPHYADVEVRLDGNRLVVIGDGTSVRRSVAMAFALDLTRANPPGIVSVRVANNR